MRRSVVVGLLLAGVLAQASDSLWRVSIGGAYRSVDGVEVDGIKLRNHDRMGGLAGPFGIQGYAALPGLRDGSGVTADQVRFRGGSGSSDDGVSPVLGVQREIWRDNAFSLSLAAHLAYFQFDADMEGRGSAREPARFEAYHFNYLVAGGNVLGPPINSAPLTGFSPGTSAAVALRGLDMDLLVLDLGVKAQLDGERFYAVAGLGPTLHWARTRTEIVESGAWNAIPGTGDPGFYRLRRSASESDTALGLYVSLGVGFHLTDTAAIELEIRRDEVSGSIGTSQAGLDLTGQTGTVRLVIGF